MDLAMGGGNPQKYGGDFTLTSQHKRKFYVTVQSN